MTITPDNNYLFADNGQSILKQISLESQQVVHNYGGILTGLIQCFESTRDSKWLITCNWDGHVKRISVQKRKLDKVLGQFSSFPIKTMKITADDEKLLTGD
jgi:hypothetical protein